MGSNSLQVFSVGPLKMRGPCIICHYCDYVKPALSQGRLFLFCGTRNNVLDLSMYLLYMYSCIILQLINFDCFVYIL